MDPLTILHTVTAFAGVAKNLYDLGTGLYGFIDDTKHVDTTVYNLAQELQTLGDTCATIEAELKTAEQHYGAKQNISLGPLGTTDALFWKSLKHQVQACQKTAQDLEGLLKSVQQDNKNFAKQALRQISLNLKTKEFEAIRKRVHTHAASLQMSLTMLNM
ncbi:hypothetical protein LTR85_010856 [Meristemomyces frigidus]|nr:hypothetical protein LTR85_010856 [Meristemomyces frigidus]